MSISKLTAQRNIKFIVLNIQSIKSKKYVWHDHLEREDVDIGIITETWLSDKDHAWLDCCLFNRDRF